MYANVLHTLYIINTCDEKPLCESWLSLFIWPFKMHIHTHIIQIHLYNIHIDFMCVCVCLCMCILNPKGKIKNNSPTTTTASASTSTSVEIAAVTTLSTIKRQWHIKSWTNLWESCFCLHSSIMVQVCTQMFVMTNIQNERNDRKNLYYTILY